MKKIELQGGVVTIIQERKHLGHPVYYIDYVIGGKVIRWASLVWNYDEYEFKTSLDTISQSLCYFGFAEQIIKFMQKVTAKERKKIQNISSRGK